MSAAGIDAGRARQRDQLGQQRIDPPDLLVGEAGRVPAGRAAIFAGRRLEADLGPQRLVAQEGVEPRDRRRLARIDDREGIVAGQPADADRARPALGGEIALRATRIERRVSCAAGGRGEKQGGERKQGFEHAPVYRVESARASASVGPCRSAAKRC